MRYLEFALSILMSSLTIARIIDVDSYKSVTKIHTVHRTVAFISVDAQTVITMVIFTVIVLGAVSPLSGSYNS